MCEMRPHQPRTPEELLQWVRQENERRVAEETRTEPVELAPLDSFPAWTSWFEKKVPNGTTRQTGAESTAIKEVIAMHCSGWPTPPTPLECEDAIKSRVPTERAQAIAGLVIYDGRQYYIAKGERERAWSLQDIAWWIHNIPLRADRTAEWLNVQAYEYTHDRTRRDQR